MAQITFTVDNNFIPRWVATAKWLEEVPLNEAGIPLYTDNQWAKEMVRRWMIKQTKRYEDFIAKQAVNTVIDDNVIV